MRVKIRLNKHEEEGGWWNRRLWSERRELKSAIWRRNIVDGSGWQKWR